MKLLWTLESLWSYYVEGEWDRPSVNGWKKRKKLSSMGSYIGPEKGLPINEIQTHGFQISSQINQEKQIAMDFKQFVGVSPGPWEIQEGAYSDKELVSVDQKVLADLELIDATDDDLLAIKSIPEIIQESEVLIEENEFLKERIRKLVANVFSAHKALIAGKIEETEIILSCDILEKSPEELVEIVEDEHLKIEART
jgi:hypothetical protein